MKSIHCIALAAASLFLVSCGHLPQVTSGRKPSKAVTSDGLHPVTFVCNGYTGGIALNFGKRKGKVFYPPAPEFELKLKEGTYTFDVGSVGRSTFEFEVLPGGNVNVLRNTTAAVGQGRKLILNTKPVTFIPGPLGAAENAGELERYPITKFGHMKEPTKRYLIPGLVYQYDSGSRSSKDSAFLIEMGADGTVWSNSWAAHGGPGQLNLHAGWVEVTADRQTSYSFGASKAFYGSARVPIIFGLQTALNSGSDSQTITCHYGDGPRTLVVGGTKFTVAVPWSKENAPPRRGKGSRNQR